MGDVISAKVLSKNASFASGEFSISGLSATEIAKEFQTPVFVIDEADFFDRARIFNDALSSAAGEQAAGGGSC